MTRKEKPIRTIHPGGNQPIPPDLALWQKLIGELNPEIVTAMPDSPDEYQRRIKLMKRLVDNLAPSDRKLALLYRQASSYEQIRQEPEFRKLKIPALRRRACGLIKRLSNEYDRRTGKKPAEKVCAEFELDLTDYAGRYSEYLPLARQKVLVKHIRKCPDCRRGFLGRQDVLALVSMAFQSPESKRKAADFIKRLVYGDGDNK